MQKFATTAPVTARIDLPAGRLSLIAAERSDVTVEILPADPSSARDTKAAEQATVEYADGVLRIAPAAKSRVLGSSGTVEITVRLPAGSAVEAKAADAELRGVGRLGDVTFEAARATVKLDETAGARIVLSAGDVLVGRLGGPAAISTRKGDLRIAEAVSGTVELDTAMGEIAVGAARGVSATLDAGTGHGRIHNALKNSEGAGAGLTIKATTGYGDITASSL
ncbi:DUF4097 family beta strand repeat-containing protein [Actinacidiphila alni]|uniref:DUF4097 family beta strand repeat-containing protein n=1 Tax=Actinacidiphila alni TaxID=380248 RepID=UPI003452BAFE